LGKLIVRYISTSGLVDLLT